MGRALGDDSRMSADDSGDVGASGSGPGANDRSSGSRVGRHEQERVATRADRCGRADPRLTDEYVRRIEGAGVGDVLVLGVVHDHPASSYRVAELVGAYGPDVLALEVAPLALPWFERRAGEIDREAGRAGAVASTCEVSAALAAAPGARAVGVDGFDAAFLATLLRNLRAEGPTLSTVRAVARGVTAVAKHAIECRLAALADRYTDRQPSVADPVQHGCEVTDPPECQAADERRQASTTLALLRAAERPAPVAVRDETREACMVNRIERLRREGDVAAVVGLGHLDAVAGGLDGPE